MRGVSNSIQNVAMLWRFLVHVNCFLLIPWTSSRMRLKLYVGWVCVRFLFFLQGFFFQFNLETDYKEPFHGHHCELIAMILILFYLHVLIVAGDYSWTMSMWHCYWTPLLGISKCLSIATTDTQGWTFRWQQDSLKPSNKS